MLIQAFSATCVIKCLTTSLTSALQLYLYTIIYNTYNYTIIQYIYNYIQYNLYTIHQVPYNSDFILGKGITLRKSSEISRKSYIYKYSLQHYSKRSNLYIHQTRKYLNELIYL